MRKQRRAGRVTDSRIMPVPNTAGVRGQERALHGDNFIVRLLIGAVF